jgi:hypothetical protein
MPFYFWAVSRAEERIDWTKVVTIESVPVQDYPPYSLARAVNAPSFCASDGCDASIARRLAAQGAARC